MIYLQKVIILTENDKYKEALEKLGSKLREKGVAVQCFSEESGMDAANCLWITDSAMYASMLRQQEKPVLVFLHQDNRNQDFSKILYACENPGELDTEYLDRVYRRYAGIPWDIAETKRCTVRETTEADAEAFFAIYTNPEITQYMEGLHPTIEQEKQYIRDYIEKVYGFYGFGVWTILKKDTGEIIGRAGFSYRGGYEEPEIGFMIGVPWQRQGYAEEVCSMLLEMAKEEWEFTNVQAFVEPENEESVRLCEKLGFRKTEKQRLNDTLYERFLKKL